MNSVNYLIEFLVRRSAKKHSVAARTIATLLGAIASIAGLPALVFFGGKLLDKSPFLHQKVSLTVSIICFIIGLPWMLSAISLQLFRGKGTPVPVVPTKQFLQNGPYRYVRNPMILGFFLYLAGWTFLFNKIGDFLTAAIIIALLLAEIKFIEEVELEKRFGKAYNEYKKQTPFLLPRWRKKDKTN